MTGRWTGRGGPLGRHIAEQRTKTLAAYGKQPRLVLEHANTEADTATGGYAHRQLYELIQNSADALAPQDSAPPSPDATTPSAGRILIRLTDDALYCADNGTPIDAPGVDALLFARLSPKRGTNQIGTFGLGFKSVLGVTDSPAFFSRSGSFRFDRKWAREHIGRVAPRSGSYPVLRLAESINPLIHREKDAVLRELMGWATNIVRLPLRPRTRPDLLDQVRRFPREFLLFAEHVGTLELEAPPDDARQLTVEFDGDVHTLSEADATTRWLRFRLSHELSRRAWADRRADDDRKQVTVTWATPLDPWKQAGRFWAYFPTLTPCLVLGVLNAPWKTSEDRQNLLDGAYNDDLIRAAATLVAKSCHRLRTREDPARHLDALPKRRERGDSPHADRLRTALFRALHRRAVLPDLSGRLRRREALSFPPLEFAGRVRPYRAALERWAATPKRPTAWLHHSALRRNRSSVVDRLFHREGNPPGRRRAAPWSSVGAWLEALVAGRPPDKAAEGSRHALATCALLPTALRSDPARLGRIVLTAAHRFVGVDPERLVLPYPKRSPPQHVRSEALVHPDVGRDVEARRILKRFGFRTPSVDASFRKTAMELLGSLAGPSNRFQHEFWRLARSVEPATAASILREACDARRRAGDSEPISLASRISVRTLAGTWRHLHSVLLPGPIVSGRSSPRATIDTGYHEPDLPLLERIGTVSEPHASVEVSAEPWHIAFRNECRRKFRDCVERNPREDLIQFTRSRGPGPVEVLASLSPVSAALYTDRLLHLDSIYERWEMRHTNTQSYAPQEFESPYLKRLRRYGNIQTDTGEIVPFSHALGRDPRSPAAQRFLLAHRNAGRIRAAFDLPRPTPETHDESEPIPIADIWPGIRRYLAENDRRLQIVYCGRILVLGDEVECATRRKRLYVSRDIGDEQHELRLVSRKGDLGLSADQIREVIEYRRRSEIDEARRTVRRRRSDAARLLAAVGSEALRKDVPRSLLDFLKTSRGELSDLQIAKAAIATWHTDVLRRHKTALKDLDPPDRWAGSARAVEFVRSLGFPETWAGERKRRRDPFIEVEGRYTLPPLHDYQETIAGRIRQLLRGESGPDGRRGMVSLPTGSGKTRVTVQAVVEAMRDDKFSGGILWVTDRGELCEQAVESWRRVWSAIGLPGIKLRISRMWQGQEAPRPLTEYHVVVATIQTLHAKMKRHVEEYRFLSRFSLVVFDEAHRSIARTFTEAMQEIGLTRYKRRKEPFLLGLTATPYRGHDTAETARLVKRYGRNRLDAGAFPTDDPQEVIETLQQKQILAEADHETIEGVTLSRATLGDQEWDALSNAMHRNLPWLPHAVEERIARSVERTRNIIQAYRRHVKRRWPTIIFATSVEHSRTLAALLSRRGVPARAVSGDTEPGTRRDIIEKFRDGELRVLVNYGIFREGFDAPKTRAIIVARPVYSPNLYFQMVGRGLRGPKNGGDERCLVLNVRDNIENYDRALAFSELDWLWS